MAEKADTTKSATGRRKTAVARVSLADGAGVWTVNKRKFDEYFRSDAMRRFIQQPLQITNTLTRFDVTAVVHGGGSSGQAGALRHALARALVGTDESFRSVLRSSGCLTRDSRMKERKKPGQPGARKRFQFSKR